MRMRLFEKNWHEFCFCIFPSTGATNRTELLAVLLYCTLYQRVGHVSCFVSSFQEVTLHCTHCDTTDELHTYNSVCVIQCGRYIWFTLLWHLAVERPSYFYFAALPSCFVRSTPLNFSCLTFCASRHSTAFAALSQRQD